MFRLGEFSGAEAGACEGSATSFGAFDGRVGAEKCVGLGLRVGAEGLLHSLVFLHHVLQKALLKTEKH